MNSNQNSLGDAIKQLLDASPLMKQKVYELKLMDAWERIMGKFISKNTLKIELRHKTLYLEIKSAALKNELAYAKEKIINSINNEFNEELVNEIRFK